MAAQADQTMQRSTGALSPRHQSGPLNIGEFQGPANRTIGEIAYPLPGQWGESGDRKKTGRALEGTMTVDTGTVGRASSGQQLELIQQSDSRLPILVARVLFQQRLQKRLRRLLVTFLHQQTCNL